MDSLNSSRDRAPERTDAPRVGRLLRIAVHAAFASLLASVLLVAPAAAQGSPEVVLGRVTGEPGAAIRGADVSVTRFPDGVTRVTRTDSAGRYMVSFPGAAGEYYLRVSAVGWKTYRARLVRESGANGPLTGDATLAPAEAVALAPLNVRVQRARVRRGTEPVSGVGAAEEMVGGTSATLVPGQEGDLSALAATIPGVVTTPEGPSVLGLGPGANGATLNGLDFTGGALPRDVTVRARVTSATYDPARGGFSGVQTAVELAPGSIFSLRRARVTHGESPLRYADPGAAWPGAHPRDFHLGAGGEGELVPEKYYYNAGVQLSRRISDAPSALDAGAAPLRGSGMDPDSVGRLLAILSSEGIPWTVRGLPSAQVRDEMLFLGRIDRTPQRDRTWGVTTYGRLTRTGALGLTPTTAPAHGAQSSSAVGSLQGVYSAYLGRYHLNETRSALTYTVHRTEPYLLLPGGSVRVHSSSDGEAGAASVFSFGGNLGGSDTRSWTWEAINQTQWNTWNNEHRIKLHFQSRLDGYTRAETGDRMGTFTYHSLNDLARGRPAAFSRTLALPEVSGGQWSGALAVGDTWRRGSTLQVLYGARLEANRFLRMPALNPAVRDAFGARNDVGPHSVHVSPRVGFTWALRGAGENPGFSAGALGTRYHAPVGVLRGGFGEFRGQLPAEALHGALLSTGLPGAQRRIDCIGTAVPAPDWRSFGNDPSTVPSQCLAAAAGTIFADTVASVEMFDAAYEVPRSWRGNLTWSSRYRKVGFTAEGVFSLNLAQPGTVDLNFAGVPRFTLDDEGGRPVYTPQSGIVPATGHAASSAARRVQAFGRVASHRSDLRSVGRQLTLTATPDLPFNRYHLNLSYTHSRSRAQFRGFDGAAFGDPAHLAWAPARFDARHQFQLQAGWARPWASITLFGRLTSGLPFTPIVAGDVNGDGVPGDRAFVFDPAAVQDTALAGGMRFLLRDSPRWARECLAGQLGRAADRNGCRGPWTQYLNARIGLGGTSSGGGTLRDRTRVALNLENPLGGLDRLLHGPERLRGWGSPLQPNPVLYRVRGFDPTAERFLYEVNPHFGTTGYAGMRMPASFRVTMDVSVNLGQPVARQQLEHSLRPGRGRYPGPRPTVEALKRRYSRNVPDIYERILAERDSLLLAPEQVEALKQGQVPYRARLEAVWVALAEYLVSLPDQYEVGDALRRQEDATDQAWEISRQESPRIRSILSPLQLQLLGGVVRTVLEADEKLNVRIYSRP